MTTSRQRNTRDEEGGAATEYKSELWCMVDALRCSMDAAEYQRRRGSRRAGPGAGVELMAAGMMTAWHDQWAEAAPHLKAEWHPKRLSDA